MVDILWLTICCVLVFIMQAGFMCLESGLTRSKNSIHVAIKNLCDFSISFLMYWAIGFGLMFGASKGGLFGTTYFFQEFLDNDMKFKVFFFFQALFSGTATTIVSGIVAERMSFGSYLIVSAILSGLIYSIFGHWAWNGIDTGTQIGWLIEKGFVDFAGSTVVHCVGGWTGLAAIIVIGSRIGRFPEEGEPQKIQGHNLPMAILGVILLWMGWYGFNGGSVQKFDSSVLSICINTTLSATGGLFSALTIGWLWKGKPHIELAMNGALAGLVSITANCHAVGASSALIIGMIGGLIMFIFELVLIHFRIDDAVGGVPVHVGGGVWGTIAVAIFGDLKVLNTGLSRSDQFWIQLIGVIVCLIWAFGFSYIILKFINSIFPMRVTLEQEEQGLNITEHEASTELVDLLAEMDTHRESGDFTKHVKVEPFTEVGQIAHEYNQVIDRVIEEEKQSKEMTVVANRSKQEAIEAKIKLEERVQQLDIFNTMATGREQRMIELKKQINDYAGKLGEAPPFDLSEIDEAVEKTK